MGKFSHDLNEILEERKTQERTPDILDAKGFKRQPKARGESADALPNLEANLPSLEAEVKKRTELTALIDTTSRAGAGGTRVGVPGIRPSGGKAASKFLEDFTGTGRIQKEAEVQAIPDQKKRTDIKPASVVIYDRCMDCMKPIKQGEEWPNLTIVPNFEGITSDNLQLYRESQEAAAQWRALDLKPGMVIGYLFHESCVRAAKCKAEGMTVVQIVNGKEMTSGQLWLHQNGMRIQRQVFAYIAKERQAPDSDIFYGDAKHA